MVWNHDPWPGGHRVCTDDSFTQGQAAGAGAFFRFVPAASFLTVPPLNWAQQRSVLPRARTIPISPVNGGASVTPAPLHTAFMAVCLTSTTLQGSVGLPAPLYL